MITVEQALETILGADTGAGHRARGHTPSRGRVLAEDIVSGLDVPPLDNSSMDGYAVRHADMAGCLCRQTGPF